VIPLRDIAPRNTVPVVTYALIAINALVWLYQAALPNDVGEAFLFRYGMVPYFIAQDTRAASLTTPLTSMFMHGGWMHVISNMWFLHIFGDNVEDVFGKPKFVVFYLLCGLFAAAAQIMVDPASRVPMVGASGAIAGVLGAYIRLFPQARVVTLIPIFFFVTVRELPAVFFIFIWFLLQLFSGIGSLGYYGHSGGGVAFFAHIGGFLAGLVLVSVFSGGRNRSAGFRPSRRPYDRERRWED
jgi:membrane associated rhomboid family serine protease